MSATNWQSISSISTAPKYTTIMVWWTDADGSNPRPQTVNVWDDGSYVGLSGQKIDTTKQVPTHWTASWGNSVPAP